VHHAAAAELRYCRVEATSVSMDKQLTAGYETGFNIYDPLLLGQHKPIKVLLKTDPKSGQPMEPMYAYVYEKGTPFPGGIKHPDNLGRSPRQLSLGVGKIAKRGTEGAVFLVRRRPERSVHRGRHGHQGLEAR
jgi:cytochrome c oxidase cbb3-type subunit II